MGSILDTRQDLLKRGQAIFFVSHKRAETISIVFLLNSCSRTYFSSNLFSAILHVTPSLK